MIRVASTALGGLVCCTYFLGAASAAPATSVAPLTVTSAALAQGIVPKDNSCDGADVSPAIAWQGAPPATKSFAILVTDPDAPLSSVRGPFVHWVLFNVPATTTSLPEHVSAAPSLSDGSRQGTNGFDRIGYNGACPPASQTHRYYFDVYALDTTLTTPPAASRKDVMNAMEGHILAHGQIMARFKH